MYGTSIHGVRFVGQQGCEPSPLTLMPIVLCPQGPPQLVTSLKPQGRLIAFVLFWVGERGLEAVGGVDLPG